MMLVAPTHKSRTMLGERGFTLTEMLVTVMLMTLASTLLATGVPVAIDAYQKTVNSANAQIALSTTLTVLRTEVGMSSDVRVVDGKIYYLSEEGYWASISNPVEHGNDTYRGLEKQFYAGEPTSDEVDSVNGLTAIADMRYPLVTDSAVTAPLHVSFVVGPHTSHSEPLVISSISVIDESTPPHELAEVENYRILLRFDS